MNLISDVKRVWNGLRSIETLALWYAKNQDTSNVPNLLNLKFDSSHSFGANKASLITDLSSYPTHMFHMVNDDAFFASLAQQIENALFKNGWYVDRATDDEGNPLGSASFVNSLTDKLKEIDYQSLVIKMFYARWLDGGGNALLFTRKRDQLEFVVEPFFERGYPRVQLTVDDKHNLILKYEVIDRGREPVYTLVPGENYFTHLRYTPGGDYRFSSNPAKKAVYWFMLKAYAGGAASSAFENGPQDQTILSPKYSELKTFVELLAGSQTARIGDVSFSNLLQEMMERGELDRTIIRDIVANPRKQNAMLQMQVPYEVTKLDRNLQKLMADKIIEISDTQMQYSLRSDRSLLDSRQSKYTNAEISKDSWNNYVLDPEKKYIEEITQEWILPVLDPDYNSELYPFRFGRDADAEAIAVYEAKTARNKSVAEILEKIVFIPGVEYNFNTNQIEPVDQEPKEPVDNKIDGDEIVEESEEVRHLRKNADDFGFVMLSVNANKIKEYQEKIDKEDLYMDKTESWVEGIVKFPHMTVGAMLRPTVKLSDITQVVQEYFDAESMSRYTLGVNGIEVFENDDKPYDVVVLKVNPSPEMIEMNEKLMALGNETEFNEFKPHITLAYVKKGKGKAYIQKKLRLSVNWTDIVFSPPKTDKKISILKGIERKKKTYQRTLASQVLNSSETRKFLAVVGGAISRQLKKYNDRLLTKETTSQAMQDLDKDFPPVSSVGLTVQTYKQQLNKVGQKGIKTFEQESKEKATQKITASVLELLDDKSQMMIKGWESLDATQRQRLLQVYEEGYRGYKGMDDKTIQQVNTILRNAVKDKKNITETSKRLVEQIPSISENRARKIVNTEVSQSLAATRRLSFIEANWQGHGWRDVGDDKVRPTHRQNTEQGVIPITEAFEGTGTRSPSEEIDCRCDEFFEKELS